ncbi:hypothetical protein NPIL_575221 [Nephila pilipes]|uniref:Uncharacterized protein n=1 Tax=Nephila pilipes TaxID=299642 RepID=A0A8X6QGY3_NEPPI|nr:hypothetical protein NPIL_575221 [Nephila pilipes]
MTAITELSPPSLAITPWGLRMADWDSAPLRLQWTKALRSNPPSDFKTSGSPLDPDHWEAPETSSGTATQGFEQNLGTQAMEPSSTHTQKN